MNKGLIGAVKIGAALGALKRKKGEEIRQERALIAEFGENLAMQKALEQKHAGEESVAKRKLSEQRSEIMKLKIDSLLFRLGLKGVSKKKAAEKGRDIERLKDNDYIIKLQKSRLEQMKTRMSRDDYKKVENFLNMGYVYLVKVSLDMMENRKNKAKTKQPKALSRKKVYIWA